MNQENLTELQTKYRICSKCESPLEQKEGNVCECGHVVTKRERMLYQMNSKRVEEKNSTKSGILGQIFLGTGIVFFIGFFGQSFSRANKAPLIFGIVVALAYLPSFYVNSKNLMFERISSWLIWIAMIYLFSFSPV